MLTYQAQHWWGQMTWCCVPYSPSSGGKRGSTMAQAPHISLKCKKSYSTTLLDFTLSFSRLSHIASFFLQQGPFNTEKFGCLQNKTWHRCFLLFGTLTWFDVPDVPANQEVDKTVQGHHYQAPVEAHVVSLDGTVLNIIPVNPHHLDFIPSQELGSKSKCRCGGQTLEQNLSSSLQLPMSN